MAYDPTGKIIKQQIVCAAVRLKDGLIITGSRHFDPVMVAVLERLYPRDADYSEALKGHEQGFIDQKRTFFGRTDAWEIAKRAGQLQYSCGGEEAGGGTLFSEHLY